MNDDPGRRDHALRVAYGLQDGTRLSRPWRKIVMALAVLGCLGLSVLGGLLPVMPGWIFFVLGLYLLATEFKTGQRWVTAARRRLPWVSDWISRARSHRWAPRHLQEFDDLTDPRRQ